MRLSSVHAAGTGSLESRADRVQIEKRAVLPRLSLWHLCATFMEDLPGDAGGLRARLHDSRFVVFALIGAKRKLWPRSDFGDCQGHGGKDSEVPIWDGSPNAFERSATQCNWYHFYLAAPRVWHQLTGSAKSVVCNLNPNVYATANGFDKLLEVLRGSPLQRLPCRTHFKGWSAGRACTSGRASACHN